MRNLLVSLAVLLGGSLSLATTVSAATPVELQTKKSITASLRKDLAALRARQAKVRKAETVLRGLAKEKPPAGLPEQDAKVWPKWIAFAKSSQGRVRKTASVFDAKLDALGTKLDAIDASGNQAQLLQATKEMQELRMSFNLQYLQLQQSMQHENRKFTVISNIMKTKHDTAKNAIDNIR